MKYITLMTFALLIAFYYHFLPDIQNYWNDYIVVKDPLLIVAAVDPVPKTASEASLENELNELNVPDFDLPNRLPLESRLPAPEPDFAVIFRGLDRAVISARLTTTVLKIPYRMGEHFRKGDLLVLLDDTVYVGLKRKAEGNLAKAQAELSAKEQLYKQDIASIYEIKTAEANVAISQSDLINANYAIEACHIIAPYDGKIVNLFVEPFEQIQEGKPLIEIVNDEFLIGQVLAPASVLAKVNLNQPVNIFVREINAWVPGKVLRIDAVLDPASSTFKIDLVVENRHSQLRAGMIGRVAFNSAEAIPIQPYRSSL